MVHSVIGRAAIVNDVTQGHGLLHGKETQAFADAGYQGAAKRLKVTGVDWHVAMRPGKRRALDRHSPRGDLLDKSEQLKVSERARAEHPFRIKKRQFGFTKVRYKGPAKHTTQLVTLFAWVICGWPAAKFFAGCRDECVCNASKRSPAA